jgi:hypothetical protein
MSTQIFRRYRLSIVAAALAALAFSSCQAAGSFQTRPPFAVDDGDLSPNGTSAEPSLRANPIIGSCGKGRIRDTRTHACHGPADIQGGAS